MLYLEAMHVFFRQSSPVGPEVSKYNRLARESQGSSCSASPVWGLPAQASVLGFLHEFLSSGDQARVLALQGKHFADFFYIPSLWEL